MTPREQLIEAALAQYQDGYLRTHSERAERIVDALLAHRDLLLEALGGERLEHFVQRELTAVMYRFPVSEEVQT